MKTIFLLGTMFLLSSFSFADDHFSQLLDRCVKTDTNGSAVANFGRFDFYTCGGVSSKSGGYIYLVGEKDVTAKNAEPKRTIQFYKDKFFGKQGGGLSENVAFLNSFEIGNRSVYEVLPYADKIVFVLVDGRAYDILTFVCDEKGIQKISETVEPDDFDAKPGYPHDSKNN